MMPAGVVKGGTAMKLRLGQTGSRFSTDFDLARRGEYSDFLEDLDSKLSAGWEGFTGREWRPRCLRRGRLVSPPAMSCSP